MECFFGNACVLDHVTKANIVRKQVFSSPIKLKFLFRQHDHIGADFCREPRINSATVSSETPARNRTNEPRLLIQKLTLRHLDTSVRLQPHRRLLPR